MATKTNVISQGVRNVVELLPQENVDAAVAFVKKSAGNAYKVATGGDLASIANKGLVGASIVAEGLVRAGAPSAAVAEIFEDSPLHREVFQSIVRLGKSLLQAEDKLRPGLGADTSDTARDVLRIKLGGTLTRAFGSLENARRVQMALATMTAADFEWLADINQATGRG